MKFVIAPDSFKGSLTAKEVATLIKKGVQKIYPHAEYTLIPMADGGEGTVQSLVDATGGDLIYTSVHNSINQPVKAYYGILGNHQTAVIEMAQASGLQYVNDQNKNPMVTTTFGTGELIKDALNHGVKEIIIGMGGSATIDGGAGMAQALGANLLDESDHEIPIGGGSLSKLNKIKINNLDKRLFSTKIKAACDVLNPLIGPTGAAKMFGPQKGATPDQVAKLEHNLNHFSQIINRDLKTNVAQISGAGAAGGLGAGLFAFTNATSYSGVDLVLKYTKFYQKIKKADYVFTGEGQIDVQTRLGKTPYGVAQAVKKTLPNTPVIALAGSLGSGIDDLLNDHIIDVAYATSTGVKDLQKAIKDAFKDIPLVAENIARLIKLSSSATSI